ncbi:uncharacterized protein RAG0_09601 [Rhynchosporium agropyri]|uniref:Uncharacterized protein n=1 Tax=Rhynchosporium agropyri TaxID=914238 RepID=A0A1E1KW61_9HELO|nr:uncharacterized protein RAG0_09601 [Rhynchosporium agropyri]
MPHTGPMCNVRPASGGHVQFKRLRFKAVVKSILVVVMEVMVVVLGSLDTPRLSRQFLLKEHLSPLPLQQLKLSTIPSMASLATKSRSTSSLVPSAQSSTPIPAIGTSPEKTSAIPPTGAIAGGAVAGIGILVIGPLIFCFYQKRRPKESFTTQQWATSYDQQR